MKSNSNLFPKSSSARQMETLKKKIRETMAEEKKKKKKKKPKSHFSKEERELMDEVKFQKKMSHLSLRIKKVK